jgi:hypothetical protein
MQFSVDKSVCRLSIIVIRRVIRRRNLGCSVAALLINFVDILRNDGNENAKIFFLPESEANKKAKRSEQSEANKANFFFEIEKSEAKRSVNKARRSKSRKSESKSAFAQNFWAKWGGGTNNSVHRIIL